MYSKTALLSLHSFSDEVELMPDVVPAKSSPLYGDGEMETINKLLVRDPLTGSVDNIVSYLLKHNVSDEAIKSLLVKVQSEPSIYRGMSDDEMISALIPKQMQDMADMHEISKALRGYLSGIISDLETGSASDSTSDSTPDSGSDSGSAS